MSNLINSFYMKRVFKITMLTVIAVVAIGTIWSNAVLGANAKPLLGDSGCDDVCEASPGDYCIVVTPTDPPTCDDMKVKDDCEL
jgi:hypothetical protein